MSETVFDIVAELRRCNFESTIYDNAEMKQFCDRLEAAMEIDQDFRRVNVHKLKSWADALESANADPDSTVGEVVKQIRKARE